jgi:hypothetical protein
MPVSPLQSYPELGLLKALPTETDFLVSRLYSGFPSRVKNTPGPNSRGDLARYRSRFTARLQALDPAIEGVELFFAQ